MSDPVDDELRPLLDMHARLAEVTAGDAARWLTYAMFFVLEEDERHQVARDDRAAEESDPSANPTQRLVAIVQASLPQDDDALERRIRNVIKAGNPDPAAQPSESELAATIRWMRDGPSGQQRSGLSPR